MREIGKIRSKRDDRGGREGGGGAGVELLPVVTHPKMII